MNQFGNHVGTPLGLIDEKILERIKRKAMKDELKKWFTIDHKDRYTFAVLNSIRSSLHK